MIKYSNGNTTVTILEDGTKIREWDGDAELYFPESIDVKISDYCDLGCSWCHESSTTSGKHGDLDKLFQVLFELPAGIELAIGGGNPLSHPNLTPFLYKLKEKGFIVNLTVNQGHLKPFFSMLEFLIKEDLVKGIGISITSNNFKYVEMLKGLTDHVVYHVIAGVNKVEIIDTLMNVGNPCKVLVLGYKKFGFGVQYHNTEIDNEIRRWYMSLPKYIGKCLLSFDNLAIEQLNIKRLFTSQGWDRFFMGEDFSHSMYIDAVKQQYAPTSRSSERKSFKDYTLLKYFNNYKRNDI